MELSSLLSGEPARLPKQPALGKTVTFELLLDGGSKTRARLPLKAEVKPQDSTESIITTVKNFYGIAEGLGVSFEDVRGTTIIANYDNLSNDMVIYVRTVANATALATINTYPHYQHVMAGELHARPSLGEAFQMLPPHVYEYPGSPSRPNSRTARKRSTSPTHGRGRRSVSQQKQGSFSAASRGSSANGSYHEDAMNGYSDSEAGRSSITGSKKARSEQFASAEISQENIMQDGRRPKALFDSSELPLFAPPQIPIPTSTSSISPQRRTVPQDGVSPFQPPAQKLYGYEPQTMRSPQNYGTNMYRNGLDASFNNNSAQNIPQHRHRLRDRPNVQSGSQSTHGRARYSGQGVLPTPDPTVASCISDEDVARQLIALGDASNFSHGRTSASTLDDALSGVAELASSTGATSESEEESEVDERRFKSRKITGEEDDDYEHEALIKNEFDDYEGAPKTKKIKTKAYDGSLNNYRSSKSSTSKSGKTGKARANTLPKLSKPTTNLGLMKAPTAPTMPAQPRKTSSSSTLNIQNQLGADEEDLSSKPRCQRCRKSKKGCDRQRPCQRCKDAGIGIEGCISEDEGNGRKGRYGRHMGVPLKNASETMTDDEDTPLPTQAILLGVEASVDKSKKRKR